MESILQLSAASDKSAPVADLDESVEPCHAVLVPGNAGQSLSGDSPVTVESPTTDPTEHPTVTCNCCRHCHPPHLNPITDSASPPMQSYPAAFPRSSTPAMSSSSAEFLPPGMSSPPASFLPPASCAEEDLELTLHSMTSPDTVISEESSSADDPADTSYKVGDVSSDSSSNTAADKRQEAHDPVSQRKYIVFENQLEKLLSHCPDCGAPVEEAEQTITGSLLSVNLHCLNGHNVVWDSQPTYGRGMVKTGYGNLLIAAAILFSGGLYSSFSLWASLLNLGVLRQVILLQNSAKHSLPGHQPCLVSSS